MEEVFTEIKPYNDGYLGVSDIYELWYAEYGNPDGIPVLWVHGGPGGGSSEKNVDNFDTDFYRVILLDQRGAGKSIPFAETIENNTPNLIEDIEKLRLHLEINKWLLCGTSWGTLLSLTYAIAHPNNVLGLILCGVFTGTEAEMEHLWYGLRDNFPQTYIPAIKALTKFDTKTAYVQVTEEIINASVSKPEMLVALAKIYMHYQANNFFIPENYIMQNLDKIKHLDSVIVNGRYDNICKPKIAYDLHQGLPNSRLHIIEGAGHTKAEAPMAKALKDAIVEMQEIIWNSYPAKAP